MSDIQNSTLNKSFVALSKRHDLDLHAIQLMVWLKNQDLQKNFGTCRWTRHKSIIIVISFCSIGSKYSSICCRMLVLVSFPLALGGKILHIFWKRISSSILFLQNLSFLMNSCHVWLTSRQSARLLLHKEFKICSPK